MVASKEMITMLPMILSLVSIYLVIRVHSFEEKMMFNVQMFQGKQQLVTQASHLPKTRREKGSIILEMKNKDHKLNWIRMLHKQLSLDNDRVNSVQNIIQKMALESSTSSSSQPQIPLSSGIKLGTANYIVAVELGNQKMALTVDTGSDLTWVQCEPCITCYDQMLPIFNPSNSSSYKSILCNSSACESLESARTYPIDDDHDDSSCTCTYEVNYLDGSYTNGELGAEDISIGNFSEGNFVFGCGNNNKGMFGMTSGVIGLGKGRLSLVSQIEKLQGVFSYCLPTSYDGASGSLALGNNSSFFRNETPISYTKMVLNPQLSNFYVINLIGMSVGGVELQVPNLRNDGVLIDSGTVITRLTPSIYDTLKEEFIRQFSDFPKVPGFEILDTCFDLTGHNEVNVPVIRMNFEGNAELKVDVSGIFVPMEEDGGSKVCLAIARLSDESSISIIGNYQQINQRVIYDNKESVIGFAKETCSFN